MLARNPVMWMILLRVIFPGEERGRRVFNKCMQSEHCGMKPLKGLAEEIRMYKSLSKRSVQLSKHLYHKIKLGSGITQVRKYWGQI